MSDGSEDTTINPLEELILQEFGRGALAILGELIVLTLFYGIFITLFCMSVYMTFRRGLRSRANWAVLIGTCLNFALQTVQWIMLLTYFIFILQLFLVHNDNLSLADRIILEHQTQSRFVNPIAILAGLPLLISDSFVIWRASVLFNRQGMLSIPLACLIGSLGAYIAKSAIPESKVAGAVLNWIFFGLSLATNAICTAMIGWRLRKHDMLNPGTKSTVYRKIITVIFESGAAICVMQGAFIITQIPVGTGADSVAHVVTQQILYSSAALYPTAVLLICRNQSSPIDQVAAPMSTSGGNNVRFATAQAVSQSQSVAVSALDFAPQSAHSSIREGKPNVGDVENGAL